MRPVTLIGVSRQVKSFELAHNGFALQLGKALEDAYDETRTASVAKVNINLNKVVILDSIFSILIFFF